MFQDLSVLCILVVYSFLGCCQFLAIGNKAAINILSQFLQTLTQYVIVGGIYLGVELLHLKVDVCLASFFGEVPDQVFCQF